MEVLIDANILIDVLNQREPFVAQSSVIWKLAESGVITGSVSTLSIANISYVLRKKLDQDKWHDIISKLSMIFRFRDLTALDIGRAGMLYWKDFEDAVQSVTASRIKAKYIVTRNTRDFTYSTVPAISPGDLIRSIKENWPS